MINWYGFHCTKLIWRSISLYFVLGLQVAGCVAGVGCSAFSDALGGKLKRILLVLTVGSVACYFAFLLVCENVITEDRTFILYATCTPPSGHLISLLAPLQATPVPLLSTYLVFGVVSLQSPGVFFHMHYITHYECGEIDHLHPLPAPQQSVSRFVSLQSTRR